MILFLVLPLAFWSGLDHAASTPKWALLSVALPILLFNTKPKFSLLGLLFLAWVLITVLWGPPIDSLERAWRFTVLGLAFLLGTTGNYRTAVYGFSLGLLINSGVLVAQRLGWDFLPQANDPGALFFNGTFLADATAVGLVALLALRWSWIALFIGVGTILLAGGKAGILALLVCGALYAFKRYSTLPLLGLILASPLIVFIDSFTVRTGLWVNSLSLVSVFGHGAGSFAAMFPTVHDAVMPTDPGVYSGLVRPLTAHNDLITVMVEFGLIGLVLYVVLIGSLLLSRVETREALSAHYGLWAFLILGLFNFPLFTPTSAFVAFMAGYLSRSGRGLRLLDYSWRTDVYQGTETGGK